jgi:tetratricopeptide (TPR) repeat protein
MDNNSYIDKQVGNYRVVKQISTRGAFGSVYLGKHIVFRDRPPVAIKLLHKHLAEKEQQGFLQEARFLEMLKHEHILPIIDAGIENENGVLYLIAHYASSGSLRDHIQQESPKPLSIEEAMTILSQIGKALHYAHQWNIVHLDLKPDNILFNAEGRALLADFGIAVLLEEAITQSVDPMGTPAYMAPEQFEGKASKKSDQYALGCIAYELLTGRRPFFISRDVQMQWPAWRNQHMNIIPPPPTQFNLNIPKHVEQAILKAMEKQMDNRHASISAFLDALGISLPQGNVSILSQMEVPNVSSPTRSALIGVSAPSVFEKTLKQYLDEGEALFKTEHYEEALTIFERAIRLDSKSAEAYYRIGKVLERLGQERLWEALAAYSQAIYLDPKFTNAYISKGDIHYIFQRYDEALGDYQEAIRVAPKLALGYYKIGNVLTELKRYQEALFAYESAIVNDPNIIDIYYQKIKLLEHFERYDEALTTYDRIVELAPDFIVNVYFKKAGLQMSLGHYNEALATYDQIIQYAPNSLDVYYQKINLLEHLKRHDMALTTYDDIIRRSPNPINVYYEKINLLEHLGRDDEALTIYDQIIQRTPNPIEDYHKKIKLLEHLGRYNDILDVYDQIIQRTPSSIDVYYQKIKLLKQLKRYERALVTYDQIIRRFPNPINVYYEKIKLLDELGRNEDILETYDQIIQLDPKFVDAYLKKADLLENLERYEKALETYDQIIRDVSSTHNANAHYRKGKVLEKCGKVSKSFLHFREETIPNFLSPLMARFFPNKYYEEALLAYITAYEVSSNDSFYFRSIGSVLKSLGKINETRKLGTEHLSWIDRIPDIGWLSFFNIFNATCISIILGILYRSWWVLGGFLLAGLLLSAFIMYLVKRADQSYKIEKRTIHIYTAFILFLPAFFFGLSYAYACLLHFRSIFLSGAIFLLCFLGYSIVSILIDIFGIRIFKNAALSIMSFLKEMFRVLYKILFFLRERHY